MVSEWMVGGNIQEFTKTHKTADRLQLVCCFIGIHFTHCQLITRRLQLKGATTGLTYLHDQEIVHGGLKAVHFCIYHSARNLHILRRTY